MAFSLGNVEKLENVHANNNVIKFATRDIAFVSSPQK